MEDLLLVGVLSKLLRVEELRVVEQRAHDVAVARVAPEGEVSEREANVVLFVLYPVIHHVGVDIARATDSAAAWLETDPVLAAVATVGARIVHCDAFKLGHWDDVFGCAVRAVILRSDRVEALHILKGRF